MDLPIGFTGQRQVQRAFLYKGSPRYPKKKAGETTRKIIKKRDLEVEIVRLYCPKKNGFGCHTNEIVFQFG